MQWIWTVGDSIFKENREERRVWVVLVVLMVMWGREEGWEEGETRD